jgi:predicted ATPase
LGADIAPFLATLLGIQPEGEDAERVQFLEPPARRARVFQAVRELFADLARRTPIVLAFEDLHWADPNSLDLLVELLPLAERIPLLIVALFRPARQEPSWRFHETASRDYPHCYAMVSLEPLDAASSRQLVANLLHVEDLPEKVRQLILAKAEGNPFFVEEMIRSLLDAKLVVHENGHWRATREIADISVPETLAGVIGARLDQLAANARRAAQTASVIGREFPFDLLARDRRGRKARRGAARPAKARARSRIGANPRPRLCVQARVDPGRRVQFAPAESASDDPSANRRVSRTVSTGSRG